MQSVTLWMELFPQLDEVSLKVCFKSPATQKLQIVSCASLTEPFPGSRGWIANLAEENKAILQVKAEDRGLNLKGIAAEHGTTPRG